MKKRNGELDFWKFLFSIIIVLFHGKNIAGKGEISLFQMGALCVEFFFIVSGLLLAVTVEKNRERYKESGMSLGKETFEFMKHKIGGLMPNYYVGWVIAFVVVHLNNHSKRVLFRDLRASVWELLLITETGLRGFFSNNVTWYISGMLLVMLLLYPIIRKYGDTYYYVIAPITFILIMGISYNNWAKLGGPHLMYGLFYKGLIRAFMEIIFGTICYKIAVKMKETNFTVLGRTLLSFIEIGGFVGIIYYMNNLQNMVKKVDRIAYFKAAWVVIIVFGIGVCIAYSQTGIHNSLFNFKIFNWLGAYSFSLYLGHGYWSHELVKYMPNSSYYERLPVYLVISFGTGLVIMYVSKLITILWRKYGNKLIRAFAKQTV